MHLPLPRHATRLIALVLVVSTLVAMGQGIGGPSTATAAPDIGLPFFGVDLNGQDPALADKAAAANVGFVHVPIRWSELQPTSGMGSSFDATAQARIDALVLALKAKGITVVAHVGGAPTWAGVNAGGPLKAGQDDAFITFLGALVQHYSQPTYGIHFWSLWNEPDAVRDASAVPQWADRGAWGDDPAAFAALLQRSYAAIHNADPSAKVILGPLAYDFFCTCSSPGFNGGGIFRYDFLDNILGGNPSAKGSFDALGINAYIGFAPGWETEQRAKGRTLYDVAAKVAHVRDRLAFYGVNVPIVISESGFWSAGTTVNLLRAASNDTYPVVPSASTQAAYVPKVYARARDAGVQAVAWFTLDENPVADNMYGLMDAGGSPKPAYGVYARVASLLGPAAHKSYLGNAVAASSASSGVVEGYALTGSSTYVAAVWVTGTDAPNGQVTVNSGYAATDLNGNTVSPSSTDGQGRSVYALTASPIFLQRANSTTFVPIGLRAALP
jgi:hypothetical protein